VKTMSSCSPAATPTSSSASVEEVNASTPSSSWWSVGAGRAPGCVPEASLQPSLGEYHGCQAAHLQPQAVDAVVLGVVRGSGEGAVRGSEDDAGPAASMPCSSP
jgi:hypothetical protein